MVADISAQVALVLLQWLLHKSLVIRVALHVRLQTARRSGYEVTQFALERFLLFVVAAVVAYVDVALGAVITTFALVNLRVTQQVLLLFFSIFCLELAMLALPQFTDGDGVANEAVGGQGVFRRERFFAVVTVELLGMRLGVVAENLGAAGFKITFVTCKSVRSHVGSQLAFVIENTRTQLALVSAHLAMLQHVILQ